METSVLTDMTILEALRIRLLPQPRGEPVRSPLPGRVPGDRRGLEVLKVPGSVVPLAGSRRLPRLKSRRRLSEGKL